MTFAITNTGPRAGTAVPQIYLGRAPAAPPGVQQAVRSLVGFDRVSLRPRRTQTITIHIGPGPNRDGAGDRRAFQYWDTERNAWLAVPRPRRIWVGDADSPGHLPLPATVNSP